MNGLNAMAHNVGVVLNRDTRAMERAVFTLDGAIGNDWSWNAYSEHSQCRGAANLPTIRITRELQSGGRCRPRHRGEQGHVGPRRSATSCAAAPDRSDQWLPAARYFRRWRGVPGGGGLCRSRRYDPAFAQHRPFVINRMWFPASAQGTLPWGLPAGKIAVAFGAEYRHEGGGVIFADPARRGTRVLGAGNYNDVSGRIQRQGGLPRGRYADPPERRRPVARFSAAGRVTDYSTSGTVETWKLGLTSQVNDDIRLRTTLS